MRWVLFNPALLGSPWRIRPRPGRAHPCEDERAGVATSLLREHAHARGSTFVGDDPGFASGPIPAFGPRAFMPAAAGQRKTLRTIVRRTDRTTEIKIITRHPGAPPTGRIRAGLMPQHKRARTRRWLTPKEVSILRAAVIVRDHPP